MSSATPTSEPDAFADRRGGPLPSERDWARRARHRVRSRWSESPALYLPVARRRHPGPSPEVIGPQTALVIDGYTRSATTFAVYAFQLAQARPVRLAHHLHAPAQLKEAARKGVPAIALIREPEGAVLSQVVREPGVAVADALASYTRFYSCLMPYRHDLVVGEFDQVTADLGVVVRSLNDRFATSFSPFEPTPENVKTTLDLVAQRSTRVPEWYHALLSYESGLIDLAELFAVRERAMPADPEPGLETWVPSSTRAQSKALLKERWEDPRLARARTDARDAYDRFLAG